MNEILNGLVFLFIRVPMAIYLSVALVAILIVGFWIIYFISKS